MAWQKVLAVLASVVVIADSQVYTHEEKIKITEKVKKLPNSSCGVSTKFDAAIYGGENVSQGEFPWMAAIGYRNRLGHFQWMCGGSVITDQYVVTAAHCLYEENIGAFKPSTVRLGVLNLDSSEVDKTSPPDFKVNKIFIHPRYPKNWSYNDIALIKLQTKVTFDDSIQPICLPISIYFLKKDFVREDVEVAGWGQTENGPTKILKKTTLKVQEKESCKNTTGPKANELDERIFCASSPGKDTCQGDSGGPVMVLNWYEDKNRRYLLGVTAYGMTCPANEKPGIYTKVSYFIDWILDNMEI